MQRRYRVASTDTFPEAKEAQNILKAKFPEGKFQIRRTHKGFSVVERLPISQAKVTTPQEKTKIESIINRYDERKRNKRGRSVKQPV